MRNFILIIIAGISISASAQINFNNDTIDLIINEGKGILNGAQAVVKNQTSNNLNYDYVIFRDEFKSNSGWTVQFCECNGCLENYPLSGSCKGLTPSESWFYVVDVITEKAIENKYFSIAFSDPNNSSIADTLTYRTVKGNSLGGLNLVKVQTEFTLSPNPAIDVVTISFNNLNNGEYELLIINTMGETVKREIITDTNSLEHKINVSSFEPGIYFIMAHDKTNSLVKKLIVE